MWADLSFIMNMSFQDTHEPETKTTCGPRVPPKWASSGSQMLPSVAFANTSPALLEALPRHGNLWGGLSWGHASEARVELLGLRTNVSIGPSQPRLEWDSIPEGPTVPAGDGVEDNLPPGCAPHRLHMSCLWEAPSRICGALHLPIQPSCRNPKRPPSLCYTRPP